MEQDLTTWLESTKELREELLAWDKAPLPSDANSRHQAMDKAIQCASDAGRLHADAETFLLHAKAKAVFKVRREHDEMTAGERKILVDSEVADLARLVAGLAICKQTLKSHLYAMQNENRAER